MPNSILNDTKKMLGIDESYTAFDLDITIHINSVLSILSQVGVGDPAGFMITGADEEWDDFFTDANLNMVKSYMFARVKLLFDPPATSFAIDSLKETIREYEYRLNLAGDPEATAS